MPVEILNPDTPERVGYTLEELQRTIGAAYDFVAKQSEEFVARYRVELIFTKPRVYSGPSVAMLSVWLSGAKFHGGGDETVHICPGKHIGKNNCEAVLPELGDGEGHLVCPACLTAWKPSEVIGQVIYNVPLAQYGEILAKWFVRLQGSVDFYVKHAYGDLRAATHADPMKIEVAVEGARQKRVRYIYRAGALLRDTSAGADLVSALRAFITA